MADKPLMRSARSFFVIVESLDDDAEYDIEDLERTFVTYGDMPAVYDIAVTYFSGSLGSTPFRVTQIQDLGPVLVAVYQPYFGE